MLLVSGTWRAMAEVPVTSSVTSVRLLSDVLYRESPCLNRCPRLVGICCLLGKLRSRSLESPDSPMDCAQLREHGSTLQLSPAHVNQKFARPALCATGLALCQRCGHCLVLAFRLEGLAGAKSGEEMRRRSGRDWPEQQLNQRDQDSRQTLPLHLLLGIWPGSLTEFATCVPAASAFLCIGSQRRADSQHSGKLVRWILQKLSSCSACKAEPSLRLGLLGSTGSLLFGCLVAI